MLRGGAAVGVVMWTAAAAAPQRPAPVLAPPERGSIAGSLSQYGLGPGDVQRGSFLLPGPFEAPQERGTLGASVFPSYAPEAGISEWGLGWQVPLRLQRFRFRGDIDYQTDDLLSPWGRLRQGTDGWWYTSGLGTAMRARQENGGFLALEPDGTRYLFAASDAIPGAGGTFAWMLSEVITPTGERTRLQYEVNESGRRYLKRVFYGGRGDTAQYEIEHEYEALLRPFDDYRPGRLLRLDRRVKAVQVRARPATGGPFQLRWRYDLSYEAAGHGPGFFLRSATRTFASGVAEPPVTYTYEQSEEVLSQLQRRHLPEFDGFLRRTRSGGLHPDQAVLYDVDRDGRLDIEQTAPHTLFRHTDAGWVEEPLGPPAGERNVACRTSHPLFPPRDLAHMVPEMAEPNSLAFLQHGPAQTQIDICDFRGLTLHRSMVRTGWLLSFPGVRIADANNDLRPDVIHLSHGSVAILENRSTPTALSIVERPVQYVQPAIATTGAWIQDINGDGLGDLVGISNTSLVVWYGLGNFAFTPQATFLDFMSPPHGIRSDLPQFEFTFTDLNKDGLADALLRSRHDVLVFLNEGHQFTQRQTAAVDVRVEGDRYSVVADLSGSGNVEVISVGGGRAHAVELTRAGTGLLSSVDDGKGTVIRFDYERAAPAPGIGHRPALLAQMTVSSSGYDTVVYDYDYEQPVVHSQGRSLVGFGLVRLISPRAIRQLELYADDDIDGVVTFDTTSTTGLLGTYLRSHSWQYDEQTSRGIRWMRPRSGTVVARALDGSAEVAETTEYLAYERDICPTITRTTGLHGVLTRDLILADIEAQRDALSCVPKLERTSGQHGDARFDFVAAVETAHNGAGQVDTVHALGDGGPLLLQDPSYDALGRMSALHEPGRGTTNFVYADGTGLLEKVVLPDGVVTRVGEFDPVTDDPLRLVTERGAEQALVASYRYDSMERLWRSWDNVGASSESLPTQELGYTFASATKPGIVDLRQQLAPGVSERSLSLQAADGEELASLDALPQGWRVTDLARRLRNEGVDLQHYRPPLAELPSAGLDHGTLYAGALEVSRTQRSGLGDLEQTSELVQAGVTRSETESARVTSQGILRTAVENGSYVTSRLEDLAGNPLTATDEAGGVTVFRYNARGDLVEVALADGATHTRLLDSYGRPRRIERSEVGSVEYQYDPATGLLAGKSVSGVGGSADRALSLVRDSAGRVKTETYTLASGAVQTIQYEHDGVQGAGTVVPGQRGFLSHVKGDGYEKRLVYNPDGTLQSSSVALGQWRRIDRSHGYHEDGSERSERWAIFDATGRELVATEIEYVPDAWGRLETLKINGRGVAQLVYDAEGRLDRVDLEGGQSIVHHYDPATRRSSGYWRDGGTWNVGVDWKFDSRGLVAAEDLSLGERSWHRGYGYDPRGFLASAEDEASRATYTYSGTGLPATAEDLAGARDLAAQGLQLDAGGLSYEFDAQGRVVRRGDVRLAWGPMGQVTAAERAGRRWTYRYDEAGHRLLKEQDGVPVAAYLEGAYMDAQRLVLPVEIGGFLIGIIDNGVFLLVATDGRGTLIAEGDKPHLATPYGVRPSRPSLSPILDYVARGYDADLGTVRFGVRDYDPHLGRFWSPDPLFLEEIDRCRGSPVECNLFGYAAGNPLLFIDPSGLGVLSWTRGFARGAWRSTVNTSRALYQVGRHPWETTKAIVRAGRHPIQTTRAVYRELRSTAGRVARGDAEAIGEVSVDVVLTALSGGAAKAATQAGRFGRAARVARTLEEFPAGVRIVEHSDLALVRGGNAHVRLSRSKYPETAAHIRDAQAAGKPMELTIGQPGSATGRRAEALAGQPRVPGKDLDEYPPAMFEEGGAGASIRPVSPADNRGAGACIGNQCRKLPPGTKVRIVVE
jgi:RHS repeat-associated protein